MNFAELKAKAQAAAEDAKQRAKAATTKPPQRSTPASRPLDRYSESGADARQRYNQSTALQAHDVMQHSTPPPPPFRSSSSNLTATSSSSFGARTPPTVAQKPPNLSQAGATAPPPALPRRTLSNERQVPAPPYNHAVKYDLPKPQPPARNPPGASNDSAVHLASVASELPLHKKFSDYNAQDRADFFATLDEFFETRFPSISHDAEPGPADSASATITSSHSRDLALRPAVVSTTRPAVKVDLPSQAVPSYPPLQSHSSSGLSICHWIMHAPFPSPPWYASEDAAHTIPPPLRGRSDMRWTGSWTQLGSQKSLIGFALFGDCSCAWWKIDWDVSRHLVGQERRDAVYRPCPSPWTGDELYIASQLYSDAVISFAQNAVASGRPVARGECWDVASEALESVRNINVPEPFPSIGRTHGHLLFYARSTGEGRGEGIWRGGDVYVRAGDIVEWRAVTIRQAGMSRLSYSTLGDPDHTAVVVDVGQPASLPAPGESYPISSLANLTVVEQSQGVAPSQATYDMTSMSKGEVWIYRPVPLVKYVGTEITAQWPPSCQVWRAGDLAN
ncbi:hypothetical protein OIV83_003635 [Microbotryomycetes sp. JL201]|nr:hypothetical protein OIV83_003635 [Microbotryomycetes sp. JL201]